MAEDSGPEVVVKGVKETEAKEFFDKVISPSIDEASDGKLREQLMVNLIKDEMKTGVDGPQVVPEKSLSTPVSSVKEVQLAILKVKREKKVLRVAGSEHSVKNAIFPKDGVTLLLTKDLRKVEILGIKKQGDGPGKKFLSCRIGAGCYLGNNPLDHTSDIKNSACYQVAEKGFGFPELGGIIHQTVGGFISTGSAGGSLKYSFSDVIQEIEFVDGNGCVQTAEPGTDLWRAVGVSMGLFGVITRVTFCLPEMKFVEGSESNHTFADSMLGPNKNGQSKLRESLENNEYMRVNWFPQKNLMRVQEWVGKQSFVGDEIPYDSDLSNLFVAGAAAIVLAICNCLLQKPVPNEIDYCLIGAFLSPFVSLKKQPVTFRGKWYETLPMDDKVHTDSIIGVDFTEIWIPLKHCQTVMDKLQELFKNQKAANNFATEIYGAKKSPFWLSMSYGEDDMVRVDPYWWAYNKGDPRVFFSYFWNVLLDIPGTRLHWGKYLPLPDQQCGNTKFSPDYLKEVYPKMNDWLKLRQEMDPDQVFVTEYWRGILGIEPHSQTTEPSEASPPSETSVASE